MSRTSALALRASVAALTAFALAACAPTAPAETEAPSTPSVAPGASAAAPTTQPTTAETEAAGADRQVFESQDGAVRFTLPEGWSVDDRSAMGEASEMYDRGPGWLNELLVLDADGDQMLWYREAYGNDFVDCREVSVHAERAEISPFSEALIAAGAAEGDALGPSFVLTELGEASQFEAMAEAGAWSVVMGVVTTLSEGEEGCSGLTDVLWSGTRIVELDVVGDTEREDGTPDLTIDFPDEPSARAWVQSAEHDTLVEVLSSVELTDAPMLDAAP